MEGTLKWGHNMIKVVIGFWTDRLPNHLKADKKSAWGKGTLTLRSNSSRGIKNNVIIFNKIDELLPKLEELLKRNDINLHPKE